jgi:hypothetical protein
LNISNVQIKGTNAGDFTLTNGCSSTLGSGKECQLQVAFAPSIRGVTESASLQISDSAAGGVQNVPLSGHGTLLTATPTTLNFGTHTVGSKTRAQEIALTNNGPAELTISSVSIPELYQNFAYVSTDCNKLAPSASCFVHVTFSPMWKGTITREVVVQFKGDALGVPLRGVGD